MELKELHDYLSGRPDPLQLMADDHNLPQELRDFLTVTPNKGITLSAALNSDDVSLTISGPSADVWPVQGLTGVAITLDHITLVVSDAAAVTASATGVMPLSASTTTPVTVTSRPETPGAWRVELAAEVPEAFQVSPTDLLLLGKPGQSLPFSIPPGLDFLDRAVSIPVSGFELTFFPNTADEAYLSADIPLPAANPWTIIPSVLTLDRVEMRATFSTRSYGVLLAGRITVDDVELDVGVGMQVGQDWYGYVKPSQGTAFPGLAALADWIGGSENPGAEVSSAFRSVGFDLTAFDLAIEAVKIGFYWGPEQAELDYLEVVSRLTLGKLPLEVAVRLPELEVRGALAGGTTVPLIEVLSSFGLPTQGIDPETRIADVRFLARPADGRYLAELAVDRVWAAGPIDIAGVDVVVGYTSTGGFTCAVHGAIDIGASIHLLVQADYGSEPLGWTFRGATGPGSALDIGDLVTDLAAKFGVSGVPEAISTLTLKRLGVSYTSGTGAFDFVCVGDMRITEVPVRLVATIKTVRNDAQYAATFDGRLDVTVPIDDGTLDLRFDAHFDAGATGKRFAATYSRTDDTGPVPGVRNLVAAFSPTAADHIPATLTVDLRDAFFALDQTAEGGRAYLFGVDIDATIDLAELPLVGDHFGGGMGVSPLRVTAASAALSEAQVRAFNAMRPETISPLPERDIAAGFAIDGVLKLGSLEQPLALPVADAPAAPATATAGAADQGQAQTGDNVKWVKIHRGFGPVQIERVGLAYRQGDEPRLAVLLDAAITAAGLTLSLNGLEAGLALSDPAALPAFDLTGLGLSYASGPVEIDGAFLQGAVKYDGTSYPSYGGGAQIKTEEFGLAALGSYAQLPDKVLKGGPTLFVYAYLDDPIGGPPFFFVKGLAAGFGYNRKLVPPALDAIATFPLVAEALGTRPAGTTLAGELEALAPYLPPALGDSFLAAGVHFTSFAMIDSFVLLTAAFGHRFEMDLLGLSTLILPAPNATSANKTSIAEVQLALRATFVPEDGYLTASAQLTRNSFVLSRDCHLSGGLAFSTWFSGEHDGDFVVTAGGYHPHFPVPAHYPAVPRLSFSWQVTRQFSLTGTAYYALTPGALMAGGSLTATYHDGSLRAWFDASMDFLIAWQPYHYEASMHVSVGVSYTYSFFGKHTINAHVGTDVQLWGPEFTGTAKIHLSVISFTISFGGEKKRPPAALSWTEFRTALLPETILTLSLSSDTQQASGNAVEGIDLGVADPAGLVITTDSVVPSTVALYGPGAGSGLPLGGAPSKFGIGPTGKGPDKVAVTHRITITKDGQVVDLDRFDFTPVRKNLPFALWGTKLAPSISDPRLVSGMLTGYQIRPIAASKPTNPPSLDRTELQAAGSLFDAYGAIDLAAPPPFTSTGDSARARADAIMSSLAEPGVVAARASIAQALIAGAQLDLHGFDIAQYHEIPEVASYA
ncbi:DUF6603 domain-containing protein [Nonomuraea sp. NPDC050153]|uniref:DUF6603 domain-containing protein n=1 Tax=Nonomuraea sp. NPDC050153 TaxID=3364359 RepID=UPI0037B9793E